MAKLSSIFLSFLFLAGCATGALTAEGGECKQKLTMYPPKYVVVDRIGGENKCINCRKNDYYSNICLNFPKDKNGNFLIPVNFEEAVAYLEIGLPQNIKDKILNNEDDKIMAIEIEGEPLMLDVARHISEIWNFENNKSLNQDIASYCPGENYSNYALLFYGFKMKLQKGQISLPGYECD